MGRYTDVVIEAEEAETLFGKMAALEMEKSSVDMDIRGAEAIENAGDLVKARDCVTDMLMVDILGFVLDRAVKRLQAGALP